MSSSSAPSPPPAPVRVAAAQFAPTDSVAANLGVIEGLLTAAADRGASVVVLPEYASAFIHPFDASLAQLAQPLDGDFTAQLGAYAARLGITVVAGLVEASTGGRVQNTVVAVDATGILATYRKQHLYDAYGQRESDWIRAGDLTPPETFEVGGLRFGLQTCYDIRFPESTRILVDAGCDAVAVPAEWVRGPLKRHHWRTLLQARAIENTVAVVAADHPPPLGVGSSMVVDARGVVLAEIADGSGVIVADVSPADIAEVRRVNPAIRLRRYDVVPRSGPEHAEA